MQDFRRLRVWQKAHELTLAVYQITRSFPSDEVYGLTSQLRRSSSSIAANLAEGCGRNGPGELTRYRSIAMGSASETEYRLLLARDLKILPPSRYEDLSQRTIEVKRMLAVLMQKVRSTGLKTDN